MHWIESAGGPLLLLSEKNLGNWGGVFALVSGPAAAASYSPGGNPTDYDRACSVEGLIGLITIGAEEGVVFGGEPLQTAWLPRHAARGGMIVRWVFGESENEFLDWTDKIPEEVFHLDGPCRFKGPRLFLFDAGLAGHNVKTRPDEYLLIELEPGAYDIKTAVYQPDDRTSMVVHRFQPRS
jgi:hypothetical protein